MEANIGEKETKRNMGFKGGTRQQTDKEREGVPHGKLRDEREPGKGNEEKGQRRKRRVRERREYPMGN